MDAVAPRQDRAFGAWDRCELSVARRGLHRSHRAQPIVKAIASPAPESLVLMDQRPVIH